MLSKKSKQPTADLRDRPLYTIGEAARYLHLSPATVRSWVKGRRYDRDDDAGFSEPVIPLPDPGDPRLSFNNLVEIQVLRALRTDHRVSMPKVRTALAYAKEKFGIDRLLIREELLAIQGDFFLDRYGQLVSLPRSGQLAMKKILQAHLRRVERDTEGLPVRFFPVVPGESLDAKPIFIDPSISYGKPVIASRGIATSVLVDRFDAGEAVEELAEDYGLRADEVEDAVLYERAAA